MRAKKKSAMAKSDRTSMGGGNRSFQETHWTQVLAAGAADPASRRRALDRSLRVDTPAAAG
jgi:hypothetical protein